MGIDTLAFEPNEELPSPEKNISLSGWSDSTLSFHGKIYTEFISSVTEYTIGVNEITTLTESEMRDIADTLQEWNFENSEYNPSYQEPSDPDRTNPANVPGSTTKYSRGPNSKKEVNDLVYLLNKYADKGGKLVYYY